MNQTVERLNLHSWYSYQSKQNFVLYKTIESFFYFHFSFRVLHYLSEKCIFALKTEIPDGVLFSEFENRKKKLSIAL